MPRETVMAGCSAAANGAKLARVEVICSYPIRPYTAIMMELAKMVADGELNAEFIHGEGEHAQVSVVLGASAAGARAYTGSSGVGVTYAMEVYSPMAGGRYPVQMSIADRTLDPPGDFGSEHTDAMSTRDQGWLLGWAETPQEVYDNTLMSYRDRRGPPRDAAPDGRARTATSSPTSRTRSAFGPGSQVKEFLPPYNCPHPLNPHEPDVPRSRRSAPTRARRWTPCARRRSSRPQGHRGGTADFNRIFGRKYDPFVEQYKIDDADDRLLHPGRALPIPPGRRLTSSGSRASKVGMVRLRWVRPWPTDQIVEVLVHVKAVGVVETSTSYGGAMRGGNLIHEVRATLYDSPKQPARHVLHGRPRRRSHHARRVRLHGEDPRHGREEGQGRSVRLLARVRRTAI